MEKSAKWKISTSISSAFPEDQTQLAEQLSQLFKYGNELINQILCHIEFR